VQWIATTGPSGQLIDIDLRALVMAKTPGIGSQGNFEDDRYNSRTSGWMRSTGKGVNSSSDFDEEDLDTTLDGDDHVTLDHRVSSLAGGDVTTEARHSSLVGDDVVT